MWQNVHVAYPPTHHYYYELFTTLPGLQFYTGSLESDEQLGALCLEPQHFPDAPNKPAFPNCFVKPEETFKAAIRYKFRAG